MFVSASSLLFFISFLGKHPRFCVTSCRSSISHLVSYCTDRRGLDWGHCFIYEERDLSNPSGDDPCDAPRVLYMEVYPSNECVP